MLLQEKEYRPVLTNYHKTVVKSSVVKATECLSRGGLCSLCLQLEKGSNSH